MIKKGDIFTDNKYEYEVTSKDKSSYILKRNDGLFFKSTEARLNKNLTRIRDGKYSFPKYPALERRIEFLKIFRIEKSLPKNAIECNSWFEQLRSELSPENLSCDGELSKKQINEKLLEIRSVWKELEDICGEKRTMEL